MSGARDQNRKGIENSLDSTKEQAWPTAIAGGSGDSATGLAQRVYDGWMPHLGHTQDEEHNTDELTAKPVMEQSNASCTKGQVHRLTAWTIPKLARRTM